MASAIDSKAWLRETTRASIRDQIADKALRLFDEKGFDSTTVDELASAVGISPRSFFRYFPAKEDVVISDAVGKGQLVCDAAAERPLDESPWTTLLHAFGVLLDMTPDHIDRALRTMRVTMSTASLRARNLEKHLTWAAMLEPIITARLGSSGDQRAFRAQSLIHSALGCFDVTLAEWTRLNGTVPAKVLLERAFNAVHATTQ